MREYDDIDSTTACTISNIKHAYEEQKKALIGPDYKLTNNPRFKTAWVKAAELCMELSADPTDFVRVAFAASEASVGPHPNQLYTDKVKQLYRNYVTNHLTLNIGGKKREVTKLEKHVQLEIQKVGDAIKARHHTDQINNEVVMKTLLNPILEFEPFAVSIAATGHPLVIKHSHPLAFKQITEDKELHRAIASLSYYKALTEIRKYGDPANLR